MNRIAHLTDCFVSPPTGLTGNVEQARYRNEGAGGALFAPLHYEPNYAYPLIVWLHGPGDDERQLKRIMPLVSMRNYVAAGPRGTLSRASATERGGYEWSQTEEHIALAEQRVIDSIDAAREKFNVNPTRIFLAGFACGGTMALRLALNHPQTIAGVLSLGGAFPSGHAPLKRLSEVRRLRFLLATGRDSAQFPPPLVCQNLRLMYAAGMSVCLRQYPCGDELTTLMLSDMDRWIMDQLATSVPSSQDRERAPRS